MPNSSIFELNKRIENLKEQIKELEGQYRDEKDKDSTIDSKKYTTFKDPSKIRRLEKENRLLRKDNTRINKEIEELNFTVESCLNTINELKKLDDEKVEKKG